MVARPADPAWCTEFTVSIDGRPVEALAEDGYVRLTRTWPPAGTSAVLDLHLPARMVTAHPQVDAVRGCVALARGPLVFCLEQADLPALAASGSVLAPTAALYQDYASGDASPVRTLTVTAVPYFLWSNRGAGAMRVWLPVERPR